MLRSNPFIFALAVSLAAPVAAPVAADMTRGVAPELATALEQEFSADAAFIRRGKLKKKVTLGYKVRVDTQWDEANPEDPAIDSVEVRFPTGDGADGADSVGSIPPQTSGFRLKGSKHFKGIITQYPATYSFSVSVDNGDGTATAVEAPIEGLEPGVVGSETTVVTDLGIKAELRVLEDGGLKVRVFHEDGGWDPSIVRDVAVAGVAIPYQRTTRSFTVNIDEADMPADFGTGSAYTIETTALDADGAVVDSVTATEVLGQESGTPHITKVRVAEARNGCDLNVTTQTAGTSDHSLLVEATRISDGGLVFASLDDMAARSARRWAFEGLTFDDPSSAADQPYGVVINAYDHNGVSLGASDYEIVVEGLLVDEAPPPPTGIPITLALADAEVSGRMAIQQDSPDSFVASVVLDTDQVAGLTLEFTDLIGNPMIPEAVELGAPEDQERKFVNKGGCAASWGFDDVMISVLMLDPDGGVLDAVSSVATQSRSVLYKSSGNTTIKGSRIDLNP